MTDVNDLQSKREAKSIKEQPTSVVRCHAMLHHRSELKHSTEILNFTLKLQAKLAVNGFLVSKETVVGDASVGEMKTKIFIASVVHIFIRIIVINFFHFLVFKSVCLPRIFMCSPYHWGGVRAHFSNIEGESHLSPLSCMRPV